MLKEDDYDYYNYKDDENCTSCFHSSSTQHTMKCPTGTIKVVVNYKYIMYMSTKTKFILIYCIHIFHSRSFLSLPSQPLLPCPLNLKNFTTPNETLMSVCCVCEKIGISFTNLIESIDSKLISVSLINDYSHIADLHIFVYEWAECTCISLESAKVKLLILNNFGYDQQK